MKAGKTRTAGKTAKPTVKGIPHPELILAALVAVTFLAWLFTLSALKRPGLVRDIVPTAYPVIPADDPQDASYVINGEVVTLTAGKALTSAAPGSAAKVKTTMFGEPTMGDLSGDGLFDAAVLLTQDPGGGSGTFFYAAAAIKSAQGYRGTEAVPVGDRIAPTSIEIRDGLMLVNYADRLPWEPMTARPSVGKSKHLKITDGALKEIPYVQLPQADAVKLAEKAWGKCAPADCGDLSVEILDGKDGVWYVQAVYSGLKDDSIAAKKRTAIAHDVDGTWQLGAVLVGEVRCQPGRGHWEFSAERCR